MKTTAFLKRTCFLASLLIFLFVDTSYAKNKITITVVEKETGRRIPFAVVSIVGKANSKPVGMTDLSGTFSTLEIESGQKVTIKSLGYSPVEVVIPKDKLNISVELKIGVELKEVIITAAFVSTISRGTMCMGIDMTNCFGCCYSNKTNPDLIDERVKSEIASMKIYPNPGRGSVRINSGLENYLIEIFDCTGKLVMNFMNSYDDQFIDLHELKAGIYFCRITKDSLTQTGRLVIN